MTTSSHPPSDLFAAKGRAIPACSKPLVGRPAKAVASETAQTPDQASAETQDDGPASVLSIDLRRSLVPARTELPRAEAARSAPPSAPDRAEPKASPDTLQHRPPTPQPPNHGMAGPFIGALVAVSIAAGVFYIVERDRFTAAPVAETAKPEDPAQAEAEASPQEVEAVDEAQDTAPAESSLPSFDLVRVEPDGSAVIAGRAAPYANLILLHNGEPIGKVKADWAGEWAFVTDKPLPADRHQITILVNDPDAEITLPESAVPPSQVSGAGDAQPR